MGPWFTTKAAKYRLIRLRGWKVYTFSNRHLTHEERPTRRAGVVMVGIR